jgi:DNA-binding GntR family transcriptional regulator
MATGESHSQRDQAYQHLRRLFILQQVPEGQRLREAAWAARLEVSRGALREAFARLEAEGFIEPGARSGYVVPYLREEDILEVVEVRMILEGGAIERIIRKRLNSPERLEAMSASCDQLERLVAENYLLGVAEADRRFHEALIEAAGNRRLVRLYQRAPLPIVHPVLLTGRQWIARVERTLQEHRELVATILKGKTEHAQQLLRTHLNERALIPLHPG